MNSNTIAGYIGGTKRNQIPTLTLASTTETVFSVNTDTGVAPAVLSIPSQSAILGSSNGLGPNGNPAILVSPGGALQAVPDGINAPYFNSSSFDLGRQFILRLVGQVTAATGTGNTIIPAFYLGSSATIGSNSVIIKPAASADLSGTSTNFILEAKLRWDSVAGKLNGSYTVQVGDAAPVASTLVTQTSAAAVANLQFVPSFTFGNAAGGSVQIAEFALDQV
jgi:hypothetical protein